MNNKDFKMKTIKAPKEEVLRYLGYKSQELEEELEELIDSTIKEGEKLATPRYTFSRFNLDKGEGEVRLIGTKISLKGRDICEHLKDSSGCILMGVTLGGNIEKKINFYGKSNLTRSLILDACATAIVEELCDNIEDHIREEVQKEELGLTFRYSPGYGDLSLDVQGDILSSLNTLKTMGLSLSQHNILMPRKSVTAIIGLIPKGIEIKKKGCEVCKNYDNCSFRKEGANCGS